MTLPCTPDVRSALLTCDDEALRALGTRALGSPTVSRVLCCDARLTWCALHAGTADSWRHLELSPSLCTQIRVGLFHIGMVLPAGSACERQWSALAQIGAPFTWYTPSECCASPSPNGGNVASEPPALSLTTLAASVCASLQLTTESSAPAPSSRCGAGWLQ